LTLAELRVRRWRNLQEGVLRPGPRASVLFGENGQGKTNLVEAVFCLTTFRSFRTARLAEVVPWGGDAAQVEGEVGLGGLDRQLEMRVAAGRKATLLDGKPVRRDAGALQGMAAVLFVPEDLLLPRAAPAERRRLLDRAIFAADRTYSAEAVAYERVLRSRNALLREGNIRPALLDTYDEEASRTGALVVLRRRQLVASLAPRVAALFRSIHADIAGGVGMAYRSHPSVEEAVGATGVATALLAGLRARHERDRRRGFTGFGPHTDDLVLELGGHPAGEHGSQGQLRSLVLALKLAELDYLQERLGEPPLLLLDDVASELDGLRRTRLFEAIAHLPGQTLVTTTDRDLWPTLPERRDFQVTGGEVRQVV
jgi:DNA replication and repair protein RecF